MSAARTRASWPVWMCVVLGGSAWVGAWGLTSGGLALSDPAQDRLPWRSPVIAGLALAVAVALPMTVAAVAGLRRSVRADEWIGLAGAVLVAWICGELVVLGMVEPLQVICAVCGVALLRATTARQRRRDRTISVIAGRIARFRA